MNVNLSKATLDQIDDNPTLDEVLGKLIFSFSIIECKEADFLPGVLLVDKNQLKFALHGLTLFREYVKNNTFTITDV